MTLFYPSPNGVSWDGSMDCQSQPRASGSTGRILDSFHPDHWLRLLVGLCDPGQWVLALGIVESLDLTTQTLLILAPEFDPEKVTSIHFGE